MSLLAASASARPLSIADLLNVHRVSAPAVSPDGRSVVYVVTDTLKAENRTTSSLWLASLDDRAAPRRLTATNRHDRHPVWSPDGNWIAFDSDRSGSDQIWILPLAGGEPRALTALSTGASQPVWSPDGAQLGFVSAVFPQFSSRPPPEADKLNRERLEERARSKVKARIFTELLYRHWDQWVDDRRLHVFVLPVHHGAAGEARDATPGDRDAVPTSDTFSEGDDFAFSPDGRELAYTAAPLPTRTDAWSTNHDVWTVDLATGARRAVTDNPAADGFPRYSPDGRWLAYRAQATPGFEADRWQLMLLDRRTGERHSLTPRFDSSVKYFTWAPDSSRLLLVAESAGGQNLWEVAVGGGAIRALTDRALQPGPLAADAAVARTGANDLPAYLPQGGILYARSSLTTPADLWIREPGGKVRAVTRQNESLLAGVEPSGVESVIVPGGDGTPIQMWIVKPPHFKPRHKYPLVFWAHGGPQTAFLDSWSYRWNAELWSAQGYILALPNPHGSTGFGQAFTNEISRDWGGKPIDDLMRCVDYLARQPYIDPARMAAAGASYGGYVMDWFEGHTDRFKTIIVHDGVFDFAQMYGTTDELWFEEWEHGQPWNTPDYDKFSPSRYVEDFKTPMLVIHNELDFRVPVSQGESLFTVLQRRGIPSEFLSFPDEGHWVMKPGNSELWHKTIFTWLSGYLK